MAQVKDFFSALDGESTARFRYVVRALLGEVGAALLNALDAEMDAAGHEFAALRDELRSVTLERDAARAERDALAEELASARTVVQPAPVPDPSVA